MTMSKMAKQYMKDKLDEIYNSSNEGNNVYDMIIELKEMIDNE
tara:strand:- start:1999 stop:2127 length:129 start_codon:yes stop_codon:yes gene_type:complete